MKQKYSLFQRQKGVLHFCYIVLVFFAFLATDNTDLTDKTLIVERKFSTLSLKSSLSVAKTKKIPPSVFDYQSGYFEWQVFNFKWSKTLPLIAQ
jgi:hypothetical protein